MNPEKIMILQKEMSIPRGGGGEPREDYDFTKGNEYSPRRRGVNLSPEYPVLADEVL